MAPEIASSEKATGACGVAPLRRAPRVKAVVLEGGAQLFDPDSDRERNLNETGLFVLVGARRPASRRHRHGVGRRVRRRAYSCCDRGPPGVHWRPRPRGLRRAVRGRVHWFRPSRSFPSFDSGPRGLDLSLTGKCNLHCAYCFYADEMQGRTDLPAEEWLRFFSELDTLPVRSLCLSGGEVFLRRDLWQLVDAIVAHRMRFSILTNGTLITDRVMAGLCEPQRRRRLASIQVSIDGSCAEVHDASRGQGSFVKALRGLHLLKEAGLPVTVRTTVNRHNVDDLGAIAHLLLEDVDLPSFSTNDAMPPVQAARTRPTSPSPLPINASRPCNSSRTLQLATTAVSLLSPDHSPVPECGARWSTPAPLERWPPGGRWEFCPPAAASSPGSPSTTTVPSCRATCSLRSTSAG